MLYTKNEDTAAIKKKSLLNNIILEQKLMRMFPCFKKTVTHLKSVLTNLSWLSYRKIDIKIKRGYMITYLLDYVC